VACSFGYTCKLNLQSGLEKERKCGALDSKFKILNSMNKIKQILRKYSYITQFEWMRSGASPFGDLVFQTQIFVSNSVIVYVWSLNSAEIVVYLLGGRVISFLGNNHWYNRIGSDVITGKISNNLLMPTKLFLNYFFQSLGGRLFRNILSTFTIILVVLMFNSLVTPIPFVDLNPWAFGLVPLVFAINFTHGIIISSLAFMLKDKRDFGVLAESIMQIINILSGAMIPFAALPFASNILPWLPTSLLFHHPTQVLLNNYNSTQILLVFAASLSCVIIATAISLLIFRLGLKKNESVGL
jgi:ABC-type uncharacterized transport system permease subunit